MGDRGKTLMFPGNIYNYAATDRRGDARPAAASADAARRNPRAQEEMLEAAARRGDIQAIILRAGDFYGPDNVGDWFDQAMMLEAGQGQARADGRAGGRPCLGLSARSGPRLRKARLAAQ